MTKLDVRLSRLFGRILGFGDPMRAYRWYQKGWIWSPDENGDWIQFKWPYLNLRLGRDPYFDYADPEERDLDFD